LTSTPGSLTPPPSDAAADSSAHSTAMEPAAEVA
jgi:hypothetical protein